MAISDIPTGKLGRVSGRIGPRETGEVIVEIRGGSEAFLARADVPQTTFQIGEPVKIVSFQAPRTVYVIHV